MAFFIFDLFGVYVAPVAFVLVLCLAVQILIRQLLDALGVLPLFWHPALFFAALYAVIASGAMLVLTRQPLVVWQILGVAR
jgi:hypothetical protein